MSAGTEAGPKWRLRFQQNTPDLGGSGSETLYLQLHYSSYGTSRGTPNEFIFFTLDISEHN